MFQFICSSVLSSFSSDSSRSGLRPVAYLGISAMGIALVSGLPVGAIPFIPKPDDVICGLDGGDIIDGKSTTMSSMAVAVMIISEAMPEQTQSIRGLATTLYWAGLLKTLSYDARPQVF